MNERRLRTIALAVGLLTLGEAVLLTVGIRLADPTAPWVTTKNDVFLALDLLVGVALCWIGWRRAVGEWPERLGTLLVIALGSLVYRVWETLTGVEAAFATSVALVGLTVLKLLGVGTVFVAFAQYRAARGVDPDD